MTDQELLAAIAQQESGGDPNAVGKSGEIGMYQFMPDTLNRLGGKPSIKGNAEAQTALAQKHLASLRSKYGEDDEKIIAAWNAGEGGVNRAVKQAGPDGDWRKFLPKGTNAKGAQYDTGNYLSSVMSRVQPQPQPTQSSAAPAADHVPASFAPGPRQRVNPEQAVTKHYQESQDAEVMDWLQKGKARREAAKPEPQPGEKKPEAPKAQEAGGFFDSVGSAFKSLGSMGKPVADFLVPPAPVKDGNVVRRMAESGIDTMAGGLGRLPGAAGELMPQSPQESQRRQGLDPLSGAKEFGGKVLGAVGEAINATPLGGVMGVAGQAMGEAGTAASAHELSDEGIRQRIEQLKQEIASGAPEETAPSPELGGDIGGGTLPTRANQIAGLEGLLRMPHDERVKQAEDAFRATGEAIAGTAPLPMTLGIPGAVKSAFGQARNAAAAAKEARIATIAAAGEKAMAERAAAPAVKEAVTPKRAMGADEKLRTLEAQPEAKAAVDEIFAQNAPDMAPAAPAEAVAGGKPSPVARIVEDVNFQGASKRAVLGPNDNMVVALDKDGNDLGYLWYTREPGGGYTVRKIETAEGARKQGVATALDKAVTEAEGPYKGATDQTPEGRAFRASRGGEPKLQRAPDQLYRELRDAFQGDLDLTEAALKSRGFKMPDIGQAENKALHEAMGLGRDAGTAEKMAAQDVLAGAAHDIGIVPEAAVEALPAVNAIVKDIPAGDLKSLREIVMGAIKNPENVLSQLRAVQNARGQEGKASAGMMFLMGRAALGGVLGSMQGDNAEDHVKWALMGAGLGSVASPALAARIVKNLENPAIRDSLVKALTLHGEEGALKLRFPSRSVDEATNTRTMGTSTQAKAVVRGINEQLADAGLLDRTAVMHHDDVRAAAALSKYKTVENILSLDSSKLALDELPAAGLAARTARDASAERTIELGAHAKLNPTPENQLAVIDQAIMTSKLSQQIENLKTAYARGMNALGIETDITQASKFELGTFAKELETARAEFLKRGNVTPAQFVDMVMDLSDKAAATKLANAASKWPEALWNIYYGLNLLGSPLTHMRNMIGNTGALAMAVVDRGAGEILSLPFRALGGGKNMVQGGETMAMVSGIFDTVADSFRAGSKKGAFGYAKDSWDTGKSTFGATKNAEALETVQASLEAGKGTVGGIIGVMSSLAEKNMKLMSSVDEFYKVLSFQGELRSLATRNTAHLSGADRVAAFDKLMNEPTTKMLKGAQEFAHENTFTKAFTPGTAASAIETAANTPIAKALVTPFFRTPVRLAEFSTVHTPLLNVLAKQTWSDVLAGGAKANLAAAKMVTGLGIMGLAGYYAMNGYITGMGPTDPELRKKMTASGWMEKSIWIGGKYRSYDNLEPLSTILSTVATFMEAAPDMDEHSIQSYYSAGALALARSALSKQWFQGIIDMGDAITGTVKEGNGDAAAVWAARKVGAAVPGAATWRYVQNATSPEKLDSKTVADNENPEMREWEKLVNILRQNIPGWGSHDVSELVGYKPKPATTNVFTGEAIPNENQWLGFVAPWRVSTLTDSWIMHEAVRLGGASIDFEVPRVIGGSQGASPFNLSGSKEKMIREGIKLSDSERHRLGQILAKEITDYEGNTLHDSMNSLKSDEDYQDASDAGKVDMIKNKFESFVQQAERQLLDEYPRLDIAVQMRKTDRDQLKYPKSMEDLKDPVRDMVRESAGQGR